MHRKKQLFLRAIIVVAHLMVTTASAKDAIGEAISESLLKCDEIRFFVEGSVKAGRELAPKAFYVKAAKEAPLMRQVANFFADAHYTVDPSKESPLVLSTEIIYLLFCKDGKTTGSITLFGGTFLLTSEEDNRFMVKTSDGNSVRSFQQEMKRAIEEGVKAMSIVPWPKPVRTIEDFDQ